MPALDLSDAFDPDFVDRFVVRRRVETVGDNGRSKQTSFDTEVWGVVTAGSDNELVRQQDQQHAAKSLSVITTFRLQGPAPRFQPDLIWWGGDFFVVTKVEDYSRYGPGFVQAECSSYDLTDQPPVGQ